MKVSGVSSQESLFLRISSLFLVARAENKRGRRYLLNTSEFFRKEPAEMEKNGRWEERSLSKWSESL